MMISRADRTIPMINAFEESFRALARTTPAWVNDLRQEGWVQFDRLGIPTVKNEEWKYTDISAIVKHQYDILTQDRPYLQLGALRPYVKDDELRLVFVNGQFVEEISHFKQIPAGVHITTILKALDDPKEELKKLFLKYNSQEESAFAALNKVLMADGAFIRIDKNIVSEPIIHILHIPAPLGTAAIYSPRTLIVMEQSSEATVLESQLGVSSDKPIYLVNAVTDVFIDPNATLHYCKAQDDSRKAFHIGLTRVWQERDSNFQGFSLMTGAAIARNNLAVTLNGEGAHALLNGLYAVGVSQLVDNHTAVEHRMPTCTSNQLYKGILNDAAHAIFNGNMFVRPIAQGTNSYQLNKNILLGKKSRVDTKPQLEIFADDVKCTHGATIGQLNEDEIFYLQSRAIPKRTAVKMLSHGFVDDVLNTVHSPSIREKLNLLLEPMFAAI